MPSKIQVDQIAGATGSTVTLPSGQTLDLSSGTVTLPSTALSALNATNLTSGTVPSARLSLTSSDLPTVPTTKGGTGLTTIGTASQVLRVNSGATGLEYASASSDFVKLADTQISTAVSSVSFDGYYTSDYDVYKLYIFDLNTSNDQNNSVVNWRFRASNADLTTSDYYSLYTGVTISSGGASSQYDGVFASNKSSISFNNLEGDASFTFDAEITIFNPLNTSFRKTMHFTTRSWHDGAANQYHRNGSVAYNTNGAHSGFSVFPEGGNFDTGRFVLYGIKS